MKTLRLLILTAAAAGACGDEVEHAGDQAARVPAFALEAAGGGRLSLAYDGADLEVVRPEGRSPVRVAVIHFFQPDCNACIEEMKALGALHRAFSDRGVLVLGIAHRGERDAVPELGRKLGLSYPLLLGQGSKVAGALARGDATVIADARGSIRYTQIGFHQDDVRIWKENVERLLAGADVVARTSGRATLATGDVFPPVRLSALRSGTPLVLAVEGERLTLVDETGRTTHPRAALGFFSRY